MSKLSEFSAALLEVGWLIAAVIAALFLDPFSFQVFDPPRVFLLRSLAVLLFVILTILELERREHAGEMLTGFLRAVRRTPFAGLVLALILIYILSTFLSVSPRVSFWGSYERAQGTYTSLGYVMLFLVVLRALRHQDQLERLVTALLVISFPVAVYGILQHFGISLLAFSGRYIVVTTRVISTVGNAIFVAAYLAMVVPLTLWRLIRHFQAWRVVRSMQLAYVAGMYAVLLVLQLLCLLYTQSRGPLLAAAIELFFMFFLIAWLSGRHRWAWATLLAATFLFFFLVALNVPTLPLGGLRELPYLNRFSHLTIGQPRGTIGTRILTWKSILTAAAASPRRALFGYGPETMHLVLDRFTSDQSVLLFGERSTDRAHNAVLDMLFNTGIAGVVIYLLLFGLVFYRACCWLGLVTTSRDCWSLSGLMFAGAGFGLLAAVALRGDLVLAGVGVPGGMLGGLLLYVVIKFVRHSPLELPADLLDGVLLIALLSAVIGHFVEGFTGIGIVATRVHFWLYLAIMVLLGQRRLAIEQTPVQQVARQTPGGRRRQRATERVTGGVVSPLVAMSLIVAVMLACLAFAFLHGFSAPGTHGPAAGLITATWFFSGLLILLERRHTVSGTPGPAREAAVYALVTLVWAVPFTFYYSARVKTADAFDESLIVFVFWLFLTMVVSAVAWQWGRLRSSHLRFARGIRAVIYPPMLALALIFIWTSNLNPMRADVYAKIGKIATDAGRWQLALDSLQRAVQLNPKRAEYYLSLGNAYLDQANLASDPAAKENWTEQARQSMRYGWALASTDSDYPRALGALDRKWAAVSTNRAVQKARLEESLRYYLAAAELSPRSPTIRMDLGDAYFTLGYEDQALSEYQQVVDWHFRDRLAEAYAGMGDVYVAQGRFSEAAEAYRQAMQVGGHQSEDVLQAHRNLVNRYPDRVEYRERLGLLYAGMGRRDEALRELQAALDRAGGRRRGEIEQLIRTLEEQ